MGYSEDGRSDAMAVETMWKLNRLIPSLRRWMRKPERDLSDRERSLRWWIDLARHCTIELRRDRASTMAAALTYHTIFSLMPTLVLSLVVMHSFVGPKDMAEFKEGIVNWILHTGILILPQHNPVITAKQVATYDHMSGGRTLLGIGVGWLEEEFNALNAVFPERGPRTDEYIRVMREVRAAT